MFQMRIIWNNKIEMEKQMQNEYLIAILFISVCAFFDIKRKEIPVLLIMIFGIVSIILVGISDNPDWMMILYSLIPGAALLTLSLCTRESIGYGDGFVVLVLGVLLGLSKCLSCVFLGFFLLSACSLLLLVLRKVNGKSRIPYMPFLAAGLGVVLFV